MLNPDGVEHGNFRFDHELRNLNRYYGQSSIDKTYKILTQAVDQSSITSYRILQKQK